MHPQNYGFRTIVLLDAGHGGIDAHGNYTTPAVNGKRFDHKDPTLNFHGIAGNSVFYEGVSNRRFARVLARYLMQMGIAVVPVYNDVIDTSLSDRTNRANAIHRAYGNSIFVSLHSNAGGGRGWEVYTTNGITQSDGLAAAISKETANICASRGYPMRGNANSVVGHKEADFAVLRNTVMPAVLLETLFFDNLQEAKDLDNTAIIEGFCAAYARGIAAFIGQ